MNAIPTTNWGFPMKSVRHVLSAVAVVAVAVGLAITPATAGPAEKANVCHANADGWDVINIAEPAFDAHLDHGDAFPGDPVPGSPNLVFDENCVPSDPEPVVYTADLVGIKGCLTQFPGFWSASFFLNVTPYDSGLGWRIVESGYDLFEPTPYEFIPVTQIRLTGWPADPRDGFGILPLGAGGSITVAGGTVEFSNGETATFDSETVNDPVVCYLAP